ncbi:hypothetical protein DYB35_011605 [Aphanomyces astaci]|uniref:Uncharacterized protein n=1 Tax=Aphanomyces astaci TaxID=112090 RepID=A0A418DTA6_APHAT|nr:hypothetical protein DYB35_011605 [Aphanomyces astaci]
MSNHLHVDGDLNELEASVRAIQDSTANVTVDEILTDFKDAHKRSAIHFAALNGRRKVLSYILEHAPGALNAVDEDGRSPLLYAIKANEFATAKLLLDAGADTNVVESNGTSCLHEAAAHGSVRACKALLERGANLNASTKNGTPLHIAVATESAEPYQAPVSAKESDDIPTPSDIVDDAVELPEDIPVDEAAQATATRLKDDGNKLFAQKKYIDSIDLYTEAIGLTPRDPLLYSNRCAALLAAGRAADALRDIRLAKVVRVR